MIGKGFLRVSAGQYRKGRSDLQCGSGVLTVPVSLPKANFARVRADKIQVSPSQHNVAASQIAPALPVLPRRHP